MARASAPLSQGVDRRARARTMVCLHCSLQSSTLALWHAGMADIVLARGWVKSPAHGTPILIERAITSRGRQVCVRERERERERVDVRVSKRHRVTS